MAQWRFWMEEDNQRLSGTEEHSDNGLALEEVSISNLGDNDVCDDNNQHKIVQEDANEIQQQKVDNGSMATMYLSRLSKIMFNLTIAMIIFVSSNFAIGILGILAVVFGFMLILLTLGIILLVVPGYWDGIMSISDSSSDLLEFVAKALPIVAPIGLGVSILTLVLLCCNKHDRSVLRIVFCSIFVVVFAILNILSWGGRI